MKKTAKLPKASKEDVKKPRLPPGLRQCCKHCRHGRLHLYVEGNLKDPLIAQCLLKQYNSYNVADVYTCRYFEFFPDYEKKVIERHNKMHYSTANKL